jgi:hypothetical protein
VRRLGQHGEISAQSGRRHGVQNEAEYERDDGQADEILTVYQGAPVCFLKTCGYARLRAPACRQVRESTLFYVLFYREEISRKAK